MRLVGRHRRRLTNAARANEQTGAENVRDEWPYECRAPKEKNRDFKAGCEAAGTLPRARRLKEGGRLLRGRWRTSYGGRRGMVVWNQQQSVSRFRSYWVQLSGSRKRYLSGRRVSGGHPTSEGAHRQMKKILAIAVASLGLVFVSVSPSSAAGALGSGASVVGKAAAVESTGVHQVRRRHRGRNAAIGILGAAAAAAIISESARADRRDYRRARSSCRSLDYRCANGSRRACRDFDYYCD